MPISNNKEATIEVRFKDIDPDSGRINQDECICLVQHPDAQALSKTTRLKIENSMCLIQKIKK